MHGVKSKALGALCLLAATIASTFAAGLIDNPVIGDAIQYLDGEGWTVTNGTTTFGGTVPGDLLTDMENNGIIGDPLYELNFKAPLWDMYNWTYSTTFDLNANVELASSSAILLIFDGVKMSSYISVNGVYLGNTSDQFVRYIFDAKSALTQTNNVLTVTFTSSKDPNNYENRWMACSGGWDWAPYSDSSIQKSQTGAATFSKGIWKSVSLVPVSSVALTYMVPLVFYNIVEYPTSPLNDTSHSGFTVKIRVHMWAPAAVQGTLSAQGGWGGSASAGPFPVSVPQGDSNTTIDLVVPPGGAQLWWPNGMGAQIMYNVNVTFTSSSTASSSSISSSSPLVASRDIGFRVFTLVTGNDTDPSTLAGRDGSGGFTMRFKVNGANMWARGGNFIPLEEMEGRLTADAYTWHVEHAKAANMNVFRVWGGGSAPHDALLDACDRAGILLYHDFQYAQGSHSPAVTPTQAAELRHQIRRSSHHPSLAMWDTCNECSGGGIYTSFVATTLVEEDNSRPPWPACPSSGWKTGVDMLWGLPNGSPLGLIANEIPDNAFVGPSKQELATGATPHKPVAAAAGSTTAAAAACTFIPNVDFDQGTLGPNYNSASQDDCCAKCIASPSTCYAATFTGSTCWFKTQNQSQYIEYNYGTSGCVPNGNVVPPIPPPSPPKYPLETHGPYQHGEGMATVNSGPSLQLFGSNIPPTLGPAVSTGTGWWGTFASEFGGSVMSSFESMAPTLNPSDWSLHAPPMSERNYAADNFVVVYSGEVQNRSAVGTLAFQAQLYQAVLGQAIEMAMDITHRRSTNSYGCITWQLGEIWPTGGWGSLEYATVGYTPGQVIGGRWKPLHYFMVKALYKDQFIACGAEGTCFARNDNPLSGWTGTVNLSMLHVTTGTVSLWNTTAITLGPGAAATQWFCLGGNGSAFERTCDPITSVLGNAGCAADGSDCVLLISADDTSSGSSQNVVDWWQLFTIPANMTLDTTASVTATIAATPNPDRTVNITLSSSNSTVIFVVLTTLAQGRFSDNAIHIPKGGSVTVTFIPFGDLEYGTLTSTLRVEHFAQYQVPVSEATGTLNKVVVLNA